MAGFLGLIFSFHNPLFGLMFGGIGLSKSKDLNGSGEVLSIMAIIVSIVLIIVVIAIAVFINSHNKI